MAVTFANTQSYNRNSDQLCGGAHSFCAWVYRTADNTTIRGLLFYATNTGGTDYIFFQADSGGLLRLASDEAGAGIASPTFNLNTWYFCAYSQPAGADGTAYIWDTAGNTGSVTVASRPVGTTITACEIGAVTSGYGMIGRMTGAKVWSAALTQADFLQEMWSIRPKRLANLHSWMPFLINSGTDQSGNGNNWTAAGTPTLGHSAPVSWGGYPITGGNPTGLWLPGYYL